ncbi:LAME_0E12354g1_1 [Lachancea meyersii CBS 8951]|uniref:LAME_0E12354g1_1 n=1 Tax=Lachancea meyersii CBS 8951 TaxID=1266667 RepID=A0A1G4JM13_9SACH|nr:LAME_0E12354g1_1 [Lachancea meyersii CBS 8951]
MDFQPVELTDLESGGSLQIPETKNFPLFQTVDWIEESQNGSSSSIKSGPELYSETRWGHLRHWIWRRFREITTLTCIALLLGFIAGSIQVVTETLVNWKSGHCSRNWLLNKSFCCAGLEKSQDVKRLFDSRDELNCIKDGIWIERTNPFLDFTLFILLSLVFAVASGLMVKYIAPMATGSGISEIKVWVSGFKYKDEFLNLKTLVVKSMALPLAISSGLSVGKEGPSVHYATCCGFVITNMFFKHSLSFSHQSEYLIAATAGGVAVAFGAPIGGVLFALEEMSTTSYFNLSVLWKSYYVALCAVATLQYMNPFRNGKIVLFEVTYDNIWKFQEIPVFIALGVFGGLYGLLVSNWNVRYVNFRKYYLQKYRIQEVAVLTLITALLSYFNEFLRLDMTESMGILFHECVADDSDSMWTHRICKLDSNTHGRVFIQIFFSLVIATVMRSLLIVISYGCSVPAGIFVPSMAVGASFGRAVSLIVERWITGPHTITPGTYAFLGAAATLSGITNLTLTVVVIMIELTGAFSYIIPSMIVVAVTHLVLGSISAKGGIADQMIVVNGFPILESLQGEERHMEGFTARDIMANHIASVPTEISLATMVDFLDRNDQFKQYPVVEEGSGMLIGYLKRSTLSLEIAAAVENNVDNAVKIVFDGEDRPNTHYKEETIYLQHLLNHSPVVVADHFPVQLLHHYFRKLGCKFVVVEAKGRPQGLITRKDLLKFERFKHKEAHGPLYSFDSGMEHKLWSTIRAVFKLPEDQ